MFQKGNIMPYVLIGRYNYWRGDKWGCSEGIYANEAEANQQNRNIKEYELEECKLTLHFYIIDKPYGEEPYLRYEAAEAEEKPKTYMLKHTPKGFFGVKINKEYIGIMIPDFTYGKVILLERDDEKAKSIIRSYYAAKIKEEEEKIKQYNGLMSLNCKEV